MRVGKQVTIFSSRMSQAKGAGRRAEQYAACGTLCRM
jgi:hypothetical protein